MSTSLFKTYGTISAHSRRVVSLRMSRPSTEPEAHGLLKNLIWAYFVLLIVEGALRKWFLPGLSTPLLVARDPLAFLVVLMAWQRGLLPVTPFLFGMVGIGIVGFFTTMFFGHGSVPVAVYGARILLIHYPMVFAIGRVFTRDDVIRIGKVTLWIAVPMAILIIFQFFSPQSAWVNRGVGGSLEGSGFSGALGFFRPSATFSFTNGTTLFFGLAAAFIFFFWVQPSGVNRLVLIGATVALMVSVPLSISRSLFFSVGVTLIFTGLATLRNIRFSRHLLPAMIVIGLLALALQRTDFFEQGLEVFTARFVSANETEGGLEGVLLDRYLGGMIGALSQAQEFPFFGYGLGLGTNVGSMLTRGEVLYIISEGEWGRLIGEMGPVVGVLAIMLRLGLCIRLSLAAYARLATHDALPFLLLSFGLLVVPQSQWGQPTTLGFSTLIGGLIIASFRRVKPQHPDQGLESISR